VSAKKIKRKFKRLSFKYLWPLIPAIILITLFIFLSRSQLFFIKKITCTIDNHPCSLEFEPVLVSLHHQNILKLNQKNIIDQFKNIDPTLDNFDIAKHLPNSLTIKMKRRLSIAQLISTIDLQFQGLESTQSATISATLKDKFYQLDKNGEIFKTLDNPEPNLISILIYPNLNLNLGKTTITEDLAEIINTLNAYYVSLESLALIKKNTLIAKTTLKIYAVFDLAKSINSQVASLQYILSNIKIGERMPTKIDLRFDKPVLTY